MSLRSNVGGVTQRRALVEDVSTFNTLLNASGGPALFRATFGQYNYSMMVENSVAALVSVVETEEKCLGFLVVNDSPTVSLENDVFMATVEALRDTAGLSDCKASNTLFLNFFLVDETSRYDSDQVSFDLVRNAFALCPLADYIVWLCPSKVRLGFWMEDHFAHVNVAVPEGGVIPQGVKILYTHRSTFMPKLLVRPARVEDNDDLLPILYNSNPHVVAGQGEFFLADLIQSQDERNKFLVGVHKNIPSGMLALSLDVNVALITKVFDIDAFPDLVIPKVKRPPPPPLFISLLGEIRAVPKHVMRDMVENMNCLFIDAEDVLSKQVSTEEKAGEGENGESEEEVETRAARAAMDALKAHILYLLRSSSQPGQEATATAPTACLVSGFPRNDAEAHEMAQGYMSFDLVLELGDESHGDDDASQQGGGEGEDDFLRRHLESVEALRSFSSAQAELRCPWYRVALGADSGTKDKDFYAAVFGIVDQRAKEVETIMLLDDQEPPKANAFAVTVFCVGDEYESRGEDLLRVAFEEQPSLDYCLYMVANSARPSQLTSSMLQVKTRVGVTFDQTLYLVHRDAFLAHDLLRVERLAAGEMLEAMERFVSPLAAGPPKSLLLKACHDSLVQNDMELKDNPPEVCFAVLMGNDVVGVVTTSRQALSNDDVTWIRTNYHIDEFVNYDRHRLRAQAQITNMVMNPVFSKWTRHVLREVMRKYFKTILYFFVSGTATPPVEILDEMVPVAPRRRMQTAPGFAALPLIERPSAGGAGVGSPLFYLTKRQLTEPRAVVPKKVVVVGGGSSSYAVLEKLLFTPHLNLTNIQLVLELPPVAFNIAGGVGSSVAGDAAAAAELPFCSRCSGILSYEDADDPTMTELSAMGVAHRVSIVRGRLTDIDRANKAIVISDEVISEYDVLVVASTTKDVSTKRFPTTAGTHPAQCAFRGMFGLGDPASDLAALEWVRRQNPDRLPIVVYGDNFETLGAIGSLLEQGVDPSRITAVISVIKIPDLGHPYVVESAMRNLRASGVYLRLGYEIVDVQLTKFGSIESVLLKSIVAEADPDDLASGSGSGAGGGGGAAAAEIPMLSLPCFSLLCAGAKYCDSDVFAAINDCGIVFDGGVVVDQNFNTIDPSIFAVGSFSRFSRVYRDEPLHSARSSRELGLYVGAQLLRMHLDTASPDSVFGGSSNAVATQQLPRGRQQLPTFRFPKTMSASLPNERTLFFSSIATSKDSDTSLLLTGDLSTERICALQLDSLGTLVEIVYIGKSTVEAKNLGRLVGWHESFLNGAVYSYEQGLVEDWIDYFRKSWATALFHDTFPDFANHLRNVLASDTYVYSILDLMRAISDQKSEDHEINSERRKVLGPRGEHISDVTHRTIESATLDFLRKSKLPRFYVPQPGSPVKK